MPEDDHTEALAKLQEHVREQERRIAELKDKVAPPSFREAQARARRKIVEGRDQDPKSIRRRRREATATRGESEEASDGS